MYQDPKRYELSDHAREQYADSFWRMPLHLCHELGNTLAELWELNPSITSLLPVLAMDAYPERRQDDLERDLKRLGRPFPPSDAPPDRDVAFDQYRSAEAGPTDWTKWTFSSRRRMAALAGLTRDTVTTALRALERRESVQLYKGPREAYGGGSKVYYRLKLSTFFPFDKAEDFARFPAALLHAGHWMMLPTNAARHLYLVITVLDAVRDENAFLAAAAAERESMMGGTAAEALEDPKFRAKVLDKVRRKAPVSIAELERRSGLRHSTLTEARAILTTPILDSSTKAGKRTGIALVRSGETEAGKGVSWYAPDRGAVRWSWNVDFLNGPADARDTQRRSLWPFLYHKRDREKMLAAQRKRSRAAKRTRQAKRTLAITGSDHADF